MTVPHVNSPRHQGQTTQLPNLMDHSHKAAPLSSAASCTQRPGAVLAWAGKSTLGLMGWYHNNACGRNKCPNSHRNHTRLHYHNYQIPCD